MVEKKITALLTMIYKGWGSVSHKLTLTDIIILNCLLYYYDNHINCGIKELTADCNVSKSATSKLLSKWVNEGILTKVTSKTDGRRTYFLPTPELLLIRTKALAEIKLFHNGFTSDGQQNFGNL